MNKENQADAKKLNLINSLGAIERQVFDVIVQGRAHPDDLKAIANICKISELHVSVALQLLKYKRLLP